MRPQEYVKHLVIWSYGRRASEWSTGKGFVLSCETWSHVGLATKKTVEKLLLSYLGCSGQVLAEVGCFAAVWSISCSAQVSKAIAQNAVVFVSFCSSSYHICCCFWSPQQVVFLKPSSSVYKHTWIVWCRWIKGGQKIAPLIVGDRDDHGRVIQARNKYSK